VPRTQRSVIQLVVSIPGVALARLGRFIVDSERTTAATQAFVSGGVRPRV
jgi:hypothetical protein